MWLSWLASSHANMKRYGFSPPSGNQWMFSSHINVSFPLCLPSPLCKKKEEEEAISTFTHGHIKKKEAGNNILTMFSNCTHN